MSWLAFSDSKQMKYRIKLRKLMMGMGISMDYEIEFKMIDITGA